MTKSFFILLLSLLFFSTNALAVQWVRSSPPTSCAEICPGGGAIASGKDQHGYSFYVCRGYISNGERRPGFNISTSPDSARKCLFELGGDRGESAKYDCLCN